MLLGRGAEQARIDALLAQARAGSSGSLVMRGEPGIGKSALLRYAVGQAADWTVLYSSGVEAESDLAFSALALMLHPILGRLDEIPERQAQALSGVLALGPLGTWDRFTVSAATLSLLAAAAEERPLLAVIDDAHWIDSPSRDALVFAARRLHADRVVMLFAARVREPATFEAPPLAELVLEGVDQTACEELLTGAAATWVSPRVAHKIFDATAGNPLAVLEIARILSPAQLSGSASLDEPLALGPAITRSFARRAALLPGPTCAALLVAAASQSGSVEEVRHACAMLGMDFAALEAAERDGMIRNDGTVVEFGHPLMRSAVYHSADAPDRRRAHRALAAVHADEPLIARRAWHLAAAAAGPDKQVADTLERAAMEARERSGPASSANAFERAARLTTDDEQRARLLREAGIDALGAGEPARAGRLLREALTLTRAPILRADIEHALGRVEMLAGSSLLARAILLAGADRIEPVDPARAALMLVDAVSTCFHHGDPGQGIMRPALSIARRAHELGSAAGGMARFTSSGFLGATLLVRGESEEAYELLVEGMRAFEEAELPMQAAQLIELPASLLYLEEYDEALRSFERVIASARAESAPAALMRPLIHMAEAELRLGRWASAHANVAEAVQLAADLGYVASPIRGWGLVVLSWIEAGMGRERECREHAAAALATSNPPHKTVEMFIRTVLGHLALGLRRGDEAVEQLSQVAQLCEREGIIEPAVFRFVPDLIEAHVLVGASEEAETVLAAYEALPAGARRTWARATAARCRGLLADMGFDQHFQEALRLHELTPTPFERARTELCYGERLRRARRRAEARARLETALRTFEQLGAAPWVERAQSELRATGLPVRGRAEARLAELTTQELQVALRVAGGATNREAAAALFLSPKTIEAHLSRIYSKLGLRSRAELARHFAHVVS